MPRLVVLLSICSFLHLCSFVFTETKQGWTQNTTAQFYNNAYLCKLPGSFKCRNGQCILFIEQCDGYVDCDDNSDEEGCDELDLYSHYPSSIICTVNEYRCHNKECIPAAKFCDTIRDCPDGSDEYDGCVDKLDCDKKFRCNDKHCVPKDWLCDGSKDCPDGSDEWNCRANKTSSASDCTTKNSQYLCKNQRCISLSAVCNEKDDCGDGSDEGPDCKLSKCKIAGCEHECKETPKGSVCVCKPGYQLRMNNRSCIDIDECKTYGICDQKCVNSVGSYSCTCQSDYILLNDRKTCKAHAGEATMVFSTKTEIRGMYLDSKLHFELASNLSMAVGVAINGDYVYWSDVEAGKEAIVRSTSLGKHETIVTTGLHLLSGIAVDWITENIYFTDDGYNHIGVCNNNGTYCTILNNDTDKPRGIALLSNHGEMYWSEWGSSPHIAAAGMDGRNARVLVYKNLGWPNGVTIDYPNNRLYWVDAKLKMVESIRLDGTDRRIVLHDIIQSPFSLAVFENKLYWSDWQSDTIQSCDKFSGKDWHILYRTRNKPYSLHIDHSAIKPKIDNPCRSNPCSQLCMLNRNIGYTCACTLDKELNIDGQTCREVKKRPHLLIVAGNTSINYYYELLGKPKITNTSISHSALTMAHDPSSGNVYVYVKKYVIFGDVIRYDPVRDVSKNVMEVVGIFGGMAFDHIGNNLYISNLLRNTIEVTNMKTMAKTVFHFEKPPSTMALVPEEGKMFVAFKRENITILLKEDVIKDIYEMKMDGLGSKKLIRDNLRGSMVPMFYDRKSRTLFVGDEDRGYILSHSIEGTNIIRTGLKRPVSVAVAGDNMFWTEYNSDILYWTDFKSQLRPNHRGVALHIPTKVNIPLVTPLGKDIIKQENGCQKNNGHCSHVCLPSSTTLFTCACPHDLELSEDNRKCVTPKICKDEYRCDQLHVCVKKHQWCDGNIDCPNGADEKKNCKPYLCEKDQFVCKNGQCISQIDHCNSIFNCADHSDEENCGKPTCKDNEFQCKTGTCIPNSKVCDDHFDCPDYSDELGSCVSRTCPPDEFMCDNKQCIPQNFVCDDDFDCSDESDEKEDECHKALPVPCRYGYFRCANGRCISSLLKCDGNNDCFDGSDENYCMAMKPNRSVNCTVDEYRCIGTDICLPKEVKCNGKKDCPRNDDEHNCAFCLQDEFACDITKCIPVEWVCDKGNDCEDKSDEKNCDGGTRNININEFGHCDEFKCSIGTCLPYSKVCDGTRDCLDGSDEQGKCQTACARDNYCKGICYKTPQGGVCGCQDGYRLVADGISCEDINECETSEVCSQICENTVGSYECSCYDGYIIRNDKVSCKAVGPSMELITATDSDIRKISSHIHSVEVIRSLSGLSVSSLDVNAINNSIYWSDNEFGAINKINVKTKEITAAMTVGHPQALAVDWITHNVYVSDNSHPNTIRVCKLEEQRCATLITIEGAAKAMSLVVDPISRWLFWAQTTWQADEPSSEIYRTDMMGDDMIIVASHNISFVSGMAIDHIKSKLYWSDSFRKIIESSNFDGSQRSTFLSTQIYHPLSISIFEESLYWLMGSNGQLQSCKLYGERSCEMLNVGMNNIHKHFAILQVSRQPIGKNFCDGKGCDYMCVLKKLDVTCICADGKPIKSHSACTKDINELTRPSRSNLPRYTRHMSGIYSATIIVLLVAVLLLCVYYYYQRSRLKLKPAADHSSIRFQNPSYDRRDEVEVTLDSIISNLSPGEHEYVNPVNTLTVVAESSAETSEQEEEKNVEEKEDASNYLILTRNNRTTIEEKSRKLMYEN